MILEINGIQYQGFTSASLKRSIDEMSGVFSFGATSDELNNFPVSQFSECKVIIEDEVMLTGFVDIIDIAYTSTTHDINVQGRGKTSILIDSSVWDKRVFKKPSNFETIANQVINDLGLFIRVINNFGVITDFDKDYNAEVGESAFEFLERLARQKQILLTSDGDGNLVLARGSSTSIDTILLNQKDNDECNVLTANISYDTSKRYGSYKVLGQTESNPIITNDNQTSVSGNSTDDDALSEKKLIIVAEEGIDKKTANDRAIWETNIRRAQSTKYSCTVQGHKNSSGLFSDIWRENTIVRVFDEYANINSDMLIRSVEYVVSDSGTFTNLELVAPDAYSLEANKPLFASKLSPLGALGL